MTELRTKRGAFLVVTATVLLLWANPAMADWQSYASGHAPFGAQQADAVTETITTALSNLAQKAGTDKVGAALQVFTSRLTATKTAKAVATRDDGMPSYQESQTRTTTLTTDPVRDSLAQNGSGYCPVVRCWPKPWHWKPSHGWWCYCWWCCWKHHHHCPEIPEPSTLALVVSGLPLLGLAWVGRRRLRS